MRRGRMFYFRKRLPVAGSNSQTKLFLCLSLRTDLPLDAVKRTAALLTVYEKEEKIIVDRLNAGTLCQEQAKALLTETLRCELARMVKEQSELAPGGDAQIDARIEALEQENKALRISARRQDWSGIQGLLAQASAVVGRHLPDPFPAELGRQALSLKKRLNDVEMGVLDGDDVSNASRTICAEEGVEDFDLFLKAPVLLSRVQEQTEKNHPAKSMKGNLDAIAKLVLDFFGDVPATTLTKERQKEFFAWMARLPKNHGKAHGKNRFCSEGNTVSKEFEISQADAKDLVALEEIRDRDDLSQAEKRARLEESLVPRLTMSTIKRNRDGLSRMMKSATDLDAPVIPVLSYVELERHIHAQSPKDEQYLRVSGSIDAVCGDVDRRATVLAMHRIRIMVRETAYAARLTDLLGSEDHLGQTQEERDPDDHHANRDQAAVRPLENDISVSRGRERAHGEIEGVDIVADIGIRLVLRRVDEASHDEQEDREVDGCDQKFFFLTEKWHVRSEAIEQLVCMQQPQGAQDPQEACTAPRDGDQKRPDGKDVSQRDGVHQKSRLALADREPCAEIQENDDTDHHIYDRKGSTIGCEGRRYDIQDGRDVEIEKSVAKPGRGIAISFVKFPCLAQPTLRHAVPILSLQS